MATRRTYGSYDDGCAAAHALDVVGDRWALIVARELVLGPKRFADLRADIPGISATVLTQRLRELEESGVVQVGSLPDPGRGATYGLTPWGRELEEVLQVLGRWGARSPSMPHDAHISDDTAVLATRTMGAEAAQRVMEATVVRLRLAGRNGRHREYALRLAPGKVSVEREQVTTADVTVETDPNTWTDVLLHGVPLGTALASGALVLDGDRAALERVTAAYPLLSPPGAPAARRG